MGIDRHGRIGVVERPPFQHECLLVIDDLHFRLQPQALPLIHSVYVYGSVARGRAVAGRSDLDVSLVLASPPSARDRSVIEGIRQVIEAAYPLVSKVDLDIGVLEDVLSVEAGVAWRYWLKHHCRCVVGHDLTEGIPLFRPSRMLALAVNGDFQQVLQRYCELLAGLQPETTSRRLIREASRKLIRSTNVLRNEADADWPEEVEEYVGRFEHLFPAHVDELRYFHKQALNPDAAPEFFLERLQVFSAWMARVAQ